MAKISDVVLEHNMTGICDIDVNLVAKKWDKNWWISQWDNKYTLIKMKRKGTESTDLKVEISTENFEKLKTNLELVKTPSRVFRSVSSWRKKGDYEGM